jgi:hypothetical protein
MGIPQRAGDIGAVERTASRSILIDVRVYEI